MGNYLPVNFNEEDPFYVRSIGYEEDPSQAHWGPGYRNYCVLHYVTKGAGFYNGRKVVAGEGFFIPADSLQEYHSDSETPWNYFWIIFSKELASKYVWPVLEEQGDIFSYSYVGRLQMLRKSLFQEHKELTHAQALSVFFQLIALQEGDRRVSTTVPTAHVQKAKAYIESHFHRELSVREVAAQIHIDERYLYNLFVRYEGISPKRYLSRLRIRLACELLENTNLSVGEIAGSVGVPDVCTFSRFFSKEVGISPSGYRQQASVGSKD